MPSRIEHHCYFVDSTLYNANYCQNSVRIRSARLIKVTVIPTTITQLIGTNKGFI